MIKEFHPEPKTELVTYRPAEVRKRKLSPERLTWVGKTVTAQWYMTFIPLGPQCGYKDEDRLWGMDWKAKVREFGGAVVPAEDLIREITSD